MITYCIEAKPQGGFIAHASDPSLLPLEAPTRQELQQKIRANINAALAGEFPGLNLPSENLPSGNKELKFDFHIEAKPGGGFTLHSSDPNAAPIEGACHEEIAHPFAEKLAGVVGKVLLPEELSEALAKLGRGRRDKNIREPGGRLHHRRGVPQDCLRQDPRPPVIGHASTPRWEQVFWTQETAPPLPVRPAIAGPSSVSCLPCWWSPR